MPYGQEYKYAKIPSVNFSGYYTTVSAEPLKDPDKKIKDALFYPTDSPPLGELAVGCSKVLIVCDDNTRRTPAKTILPHVLNMLNAAGVKDDNTAILFAAGSHRPMTESEIKEKIGEDIFSRIKTYNHDYKSDLVFKGTTSLGTPIYINRLMSEADLIIGIGNIIPHRYCGWAGGGKIIQPGVCGEETITSTHLLITKDSSIKLGSVDNAALREIYEVARASGLKFIINTLLNSDGDIVDIFAGDVRSAHKKGIQAAKSIFGVTVPESDVVVISSYPEDLNLWQALKALYAADIVIKDGGTVILVSPLFEGIGEHQEFIDLLNLPSSKISLMLKSGDVKDLLSGAAAYAERLVIDRAGIFIVTDGIDNETVSRMGFIKFADLQDAIDRAISGNQSAKVVCLKEGTEILPLKGE
jgi:nickel-dependent lactate racemase